MALIGPKPEVEQPRFPSPWVVAHVGFEDEVVIEDANGRTVALVPNCRSGGDVEALSLAIVTAVNEKYGQTKRTFRDREDDLWFEFYPGQFVYGLDRATANERRERAGYSGRTLEFIEERYGPLTQVEP